MSSKRSLPYKMMPGHRSDFLCTQRCIPHHATFQHCVLPEGRTAPETHSSKPQTELVSLAIENPLN